MKKSSAMKATKGTKTMKAMKAKRVTKIAKGPLAKAVVLRGGKEKTSGGLKVDMLMRNKRGKITSKKAHANVLKRFGNIRGWAEAVQAARKALQVTGFVAINGKTAQGKVLYTKAKALYSAPA